MDYNKKDSKDPNRDDIPAGLLRQRRNLIVISLVLLFIYYSGVIIETAELTFFGAKLKLSNPKVLDDFILLWIIWGYFLIRYTQYIKFYGVLSDIYSEYNSYLLPLYQAHFYPKLKAEIPKAFEGNPSIFLPYVQFSFRNGFQYIAKDYSNRDEPDALFISKMNSYLVITLKMRSFFKLIATSRHITDYWLPYFLCFLPLFFA